jgi:DNA polymerase III delta subunit
MPSNVLFRLFRGAQNFTREELENALRTLADADLELKSARIPPIFILEEALMSLCMPQSGGMEGKIRGAYRQVKEGI